MIKKDIDYLVEEIISDCYLTIFFHPERKDDVFGIMEEAVVLRNDLFTRANNPAEKHNPRLVKKHYNLIRQDLLANVDTLFEKLSKLCKK